jgi:putative transposase
MWNQEDQREKRKIWYRFTDRAIRNESHYQVTLNYIHFNPVKHHWVESAYDWVESSLDWYSQSNGKEWLRDNWKRYPILEYGRGWDE